MEDKRKVTKERGQLLADAYGPRVDWLESSAKDNVNVTELFRGIVRRIRDDRQKVRKTPRKCRLM